MSEQEIIKKVDHVNIRIADVDESLNFYTNMLGFEYVSKREIAVSKTVSYYLERDSLRIELAYGHDMSKYASNGIINHFAIEVFDINKAYEYFRERKVNVCSNIINVNEEFFCFFIAGPNNESIEVIEYM